MESNYKWSLNRHGVPVIKPINEEVWGEGRPTPASLHRLGTIQQKHIPGIGSVSPHTQRGAA